jgi:DNA repair protein RecN (Recombination protein N)
MLTALTIRDVVLIDRLELDFRPGLCALTGETGAGKSILLDALGLALGVRAEARLVRQGADQAQVSAVFDLPPGHVVFGILSEHGVEAGEGSLVLRRILGRDGRSRAFINDQAVGIGLLKRVGDELVEIHGQFESQRLLDPSNHRALLDAFGGLAPLTEATAAAWRAWQDAKAVLAEEQQRLAAALRDQDNLRYALSEIDELDPKPGEEARLADERALLLNAEKLIQGLEDARQALAGGGRGVEDGLRGAIRHLERVAARAAGRLDAAISALHRALAEATEGRSLLDKAVADLDLNPGRLEHAEERLFALRAAARKHGCTVDDLPALQADLSAKLAAIDDGGALVKRLASEEHRQGEAYGQAAARLRQAREAAGARLDAAVARELEPLRLGKATFRTRVEPLEADAWGESGTERVAFEVTTNPGSTPGPINRIASGGELSRFMLALKVVLASADPVPTLIFDEIDAGVGGAVAAAIGERLARLAAEVQVLAVTHSPQIAAVGSQHWRVSKAMVDSGTRTHVEVLNEEGRREEIARMLAGARITEEARAAADSLLQGANG